MDVYIYGFALQKRGLPFDAPEETGQVMERQRRNVPDMDDYCKLVEAASELAEATTTTLNSSSDWTSSWTGSRASGRIRPEWQDHIQAGHPIFYEGPLTKPSTSIVCVPTVPRPWKVACGSSETALVRGTRALYIQRRGR
jgi:hypothetical protein